MSDQIRQDEDFDVKIAVPKSHRSVAKEEMDQTLDQVIKAREDGSLGRAAEIGEKMAAYLQSAISPSDLLRNQKLFLGVFAVTVGCESCFHDPMTARTVLNRFHDEFKERCPDAYDDSGYSVALSFYYLAVRSTGDVHHAIGRTFAMLCGREEDADLRKVGRTLYRQCLATMEETAHA